ncbi:MAG TPA: hypothetical protein VK983_02015 [Candidatus Limnocylindrales bacterium]|nr:hypothetical protein [Candidatus Limnocylindrales bacterium]
MADNTADDVYDDPDNILADDDDTVNGAVELPQDMKDNPSQSIFLPEKDPNDERGNLEEVDPKEGEESDEAFSDHAEDMDPDSNRLGDVNPEDEQDRTED